MPLVKIASRNNELGLAAGETAIAYASKAVFPVNNGFNQVLIQVGQMPTQPNNFEQIELHCFQPNLLRWAIALRSRRRSTPGSDCLPGCLDSEDHAKEII